MSLKTAILALLAVYILVMPEQISAQESFREVTVYLQFSDSESPNHRTAFDTETFNALQASMKKRGAENLVAVNFPLELELTKDALIKALQSSGLTKNDRIAALIIGTHGEVDLQKNETELQRIGGFNQDGVFDFLNTILEVTGPRMIEFPHIVMESCRSLCGTRVQIIERLQGFQRKLKSVGVEQVSWWGAIKYIRPAYSQATTPGEIASLRKRYKNYKEAYRHTIREMDRGILGFSAYAATTISIMETFIRSIANQSITGPSATVFLTSLLGPPVIWVSGALYRNYKDSRAIGTEGLLVTYKDDRFRMHALDQTDKNRWLGANKCLRAVK